jgi:hypothetical protein
MAHLEGNGDPRTRHPVLLTTVGLVLALMLLALLEHRLSRLEEFERSKAEAARSGAR